MLSVMRSTNRKSLSPSFRNCQRSPIISLMSDGRRDAGFGGVFHRSSRTNLAASWRKASNTG